MQLSPPEFIIFTFGSENKVAKVLGIAQSSVCRWKDTGLIPSKYHQNILRKSNELKLGITPENLIMGKKMRISEFKGYKR